MRLAGVSGRWLALVLTLLVAGCLTLGPDTAVVDPTDSARLTTTVRHGLFLTRVRIGDVEAGPFVIDSGASVVVLDLKLAEALALRLWGERDDSEIGQKVQFGTVPSLRAGPVILRDTNVAVLDLSKLSRAFGERLAGVLGYPFFAASVVAVDYTEASVSCFPHGRYRLPTPGEWVPLVLKDRRPGLAVRLAGGAEGTFVLDTGSNITARLFSEFVMKHGFLEGRAGPVHKRRHLGLRGAVDVLAGRLAWLELAGHRFVSPEVLLDASGVPASLTSREFDGIIGQGVLREFTVVFNYRASKVAFLRP